MNLQLGVLAIAAVLAIVSVAKVAPRVGVAVPIALVVVGIVASYLPFVPNLDVDPHLILTVVLPPILYSAAVNVHATDFRRNVKAIGGLSVLLVVISAIAVGFLLHWLIPDLGLAAAIALAAVVSPPDAVAAISIGKRLGLPPRLVTVLEGEGLINDATALVMLRSAVAATAGVVSLWDVLGDFAFAVLAGLVIGLLAGLLTVWIRAKLDEPVLTTAISFTVPFLAFVPAEEIHASGVLAVVVAGLVTGHQSARHFTAQDRISERTRGRPGQPGPAAVQRPAVRPGGAGGRPPGERRARPCAHPAARPGRVQRRAPAPRAAPAAARVRAGGAARRAGVRHVHLARARTRPAHARHRGVQPRPRGRALTAKAAPGIEGGLRTSAVRQLEATPRPALPLSAPPPV
jgi:hypothetical protein